MPTPDPPSSVRQVISDIFAEFRQAGYERIRNPLLAAFAILLVASNWRALYIAFFGDADLARRLELIDAAARPWIWGVGLPAIAALAYVLFMPWIAFWVQKAIAEPTKRRKTHRIAAELAILADRRRLLDAELGNERLRQKLTLEMEEARSEQDFKRRQRDAEIEERKVRIQQNEMVTQLQTRLQLTEDDGRKQSNEVHRLTNEVTSLNRHRDTTQTELERLRSKNQELTKDNREQTNTVKKLTSQLDRLNRIQAVTPTPNPQSRRRE
jgi:hypothetical protein